MIVRMPLLRMVRMIFVGLIFMGSGAYAQENVASGAIVYQPLRDTPNLKILAGLKEDTLIVYRAANEKFSVTIFTDVFCPYCRVLHENISDFLVRGITVRYAPFPLMDESYPVLTSIWCAPERKAALDAAMLEHKFKPLSCDSKVVPEFKMIARELKVTGTPSIFFEDGRKVSGFMTAADIDDVLMGRIALEDWRRKQ